jgi:hypothetical protein
MKKPLLIVAACLASAAFVGFLAFTAAPAFAQNNSAANASAGANASANSGSTSSARAGGGSGGAGGAGGGASSSANGNGGSANGGTFSSRYNNQLQPGGIAAPGLAASGSCLGSVSGGVSFPGGGVAFGSTVKDDDCTRREYGRIFLGIRDPRARAVAYYLFAKNPEVQEAMQAAGVLPAQGRSVAGRAGGVTPVGYRGNPANGGLPRECNAWRGGVVGGICLY